MRKARVPFACAQGRARAVCCFGRAKSWSVSPLESSANTGSRATGSGFGIGVLGRVAGLRRDGAMARDREAHPGARQSRRPSLSDTRDHSIGLARD